jgi:hypothetical protein
MGAMNIPQELDWVSERAKCSPETVFTTLETQVRSDVDRRQALRSGPEMQYGVEYAFRSGKEAFQVTVIRANEILANTVFQKTQDGIVVQHKDGTSLIGVLTLGDDGRCRLRVDEEQLEFWQFRKRALESLFFDLLSRLRA